MSWKAGRGATGFRAAVRSPRRGSVWTSDGRRSGRIMYLALPSSRHEMPALVDLGRANRGSVRDRARGSNRRGLVVVVRLERVLERGVDLQPVHVVGVALRHDDRDA